jgi:hypothetical protein
MSRNAYGTSLSMDDRARKVIEKAWGDPVFKDQLLMDPNAALKSVGIEIPAGIAIRVHEDAPGEYHYVLPLPPDGALNDMQLESVGGGRKQEAATSTKPSSGKIKD